MNNVANRVALLFFLTVFLGCNSESSDDANANNTPNPPKAEPETPAGYVQQATFSDLEGNEVPISNFQGKVVMIDFWETWCKPCLASFPTMQKLQEEYPDDFVVLAVTPGFTDTIEDARSFAEENDFEFQYLMDSNKLHQKLGVQSIPYKVYVDANGEFIKESLGSHGPGEDYKRIKQIIEEHKKS